MEHFSAFDYLLIEVANKFGLDKKLFHERIQWAKDNFNDLEALAPEADKKERHLYIKGVQALRAVCRGEPTGHMVEWDACCSGLQIMSALTGCIVGATNTGMVDPDVRADAYGMLMKVMQHILADYAVGNITRQQAKDALN